MSLLPLGNHSYVEDWYADMAIPLAPGQKLSPRKTKVEKMCKLWAKVGILQRDLGFGDGRGVSFGPCGAILLSLFRTVDERVGSGKMPTVWLYPDVVGDPSVQGCL